MPVTAKRFKSMSRDTNLPVSDLSKLVNNDVLNTALNEASDKLSSVDVKALLNQADEKIDDILKKVKDGKLDFDSGVRDIRGLINQIRDRAGIPTKELDKIILGAFKGNSALSSVFASGLNKGCRDNMGRFKGLGKPFDMSVNCNGGKSKKTKSRCDVGGFNDVLNKLTNGAYGGAVNDLNSALQSLVGLATYGYDLSMCGVFSALSGNIGNKAVLNRGAAGVLSALNMSGNSLGFFDLAGASQGLSPLLEYPNGITDAIRNFKLPSDSRETELVDYWSRMDGASELYKDGYTQSEEDAILAMSVPEDDSSYDYRLMSRARAADNSVDEDDLDAIPDTDSDFIAACYA